MAAYIQRCMVLSQSQNWADRNRGKCSEEYLPSSLDCGPLVTSCGHPMHSLCFQNYFDSLVQKERERQHKWVELIFSWSETSFNYWVRFSAMFQLIINYNVNKSEYLCPICERLSVGFLPLVPSLSKLIPLIPPSETPFKEWVMQMSLKASQKEVETLKADFIPKSVIPKLVFTNKRALKSATSPPKLPKDLISQMGVYSANLGNVSQLSSMMLAGQIQQQGVFFKLVKSKKKFEEIWLIFSRKKKEILRTLNNYINL